MARKRKPKIEFRYYKIPEGNPVLALFGEKWRQNYGDNKDRMHFHNYLEIGYCHSGQGVVKLSDDEVRFEGGEFTIIPKNFPHLTQSDAGTISYWEYLFIDVEETMHRCLGGNTKRTERAIQRINAWAVIRKKEECPEIANSIIEIVEVMKEQREFYLEEARGLVEALLIKIARMSQTRDEEKKAESQDKAANAISRVVDYISQNYMEQLRVEELADIYHFSETHFRRVFSEHMQMSPLEYINLVRIKAACEYLKSTDKSMTEIAQLCGFTTNSTFNRNFGRIMGMTPGQWRKRPENYEQKLLKFSIHSEEGW